MFRFLIIALVVLGGGVLIVRQLDEASRVETSGAKGSGRPGSSSPPGKSPPSKPRALVITAGRNGHFEVEAKVDGRRVDFLVDTGATTVALRESDAARLGLRPAPRDFTVRVSTANGDTRAAPVELRSIEVGDIVVRNLRALVLLDDALGTNLLGMSFLSRVRWTHDRGRLVLEQ